MTPDETRPPILVMRSEGTLGSQIELMLLEPDGSTRVIGRRDTLGAGEDLETVARVVGISDESFQDVIVDLERVKWLDSTGLGLLVGLLRHRKRQGEAVALIGVNDRIAKLLKVTSLDLALPVHETLAEAARAVRTEEPGTAG